MESKKGRKGGGWCARVCVFQPLPPLPTLPQYRATANETYLLHASSHFVRYIYEEGGGSRSSFSPDDYFTAASALLANATDGGTYHERARAGLRAWACADGTSVKYTPRGRVSCGRERESCWGVCVCGRNVFPSSPPSLQAVNDDDPTLGGTAAAAFLAGAYGHTIRYWQPARASRYACWGLAQTRYSLGDAGRSLVVGLGADPPLAAANQAASCPPEPAACDAVTAQLTPTPNPFILYGALVEGPGWSDRYADARPVNGSRVTPQASAALGAAAGRGGCIADGVGGVPAGFRGAGQGQGAVWWERLLIKKRGVQKNKDNTPTPQTDGLSPSHPKPHPTHTGRHHEVAHVRARRRWRRVRRGGQEVVGGQAGRACRPPLRPPTHTPHHPHTNTAYSPSTPTRPPHPAPAPPPAPRRRRRSPPQRARPSPCPAAAPTRATPWPVSPTAPAP